MAKPYLKKKRTIELFYNRRRVTQRILLTGELGFAVRISDIVGTHHGASDVNSDYTASYTRKLE